MLRTGEESSSSSKRWKFIGSLWNTFFQSSLSLGWSMWFIFRWVLGCSLFLTLGKFQYVITEARCFRISLGDLMPTAQQEAKEVTGRYITEKAQRRKLCPSTQHQQVWAHRWSHSLRLEVLQAWLLHTAKAPKGAKDTSSIFQPLNNQIKKPDSFPDTQPVGINQWWCFLLHMLELNILLANTLSQHSSISVWYLAKTLKNLWIS